MDRIRKGQLPGGVETLGELVRLYQGEVAYTDEALGRVWDALEEQGLLDATLIVLVGDHGEEFWDHDGFGHGHAMYDEVIRVPLLVRLPGAESGMVMRDLTRLVDLAPTALAAAGIALPETGTVRVDGNAVTSLGDAARRGFRIRRMGMVFQEFELLSYLNVLDNILLPYRVNRELRLGRDIRERAHGLAERVGIGASSNALGETVVFETLPVPAKGY